MSKIVEVLKKNGATEIEGYSLVSNYGYTFKLNGRKYDARFWANCYGAYLGKWNIHGCEPYKSVSGSNSTPPDAELIEKIKNELNKIGEE